MAIGQAYPNWIIRGEQERLAMEPIRVLIVDDHAPFRDGLRALLRSEADIEAIGAIPRLDLPQWVRMLMVSSCKQYSLA